MLFTAYDPRISPCPTSGCWLWLMGLTDGYARSRIAGRLWLVHRWIWEKVKGPIPEGMVLDHMCRVRSCVNPDHLRVVTKGQNTLQNSDSIQAKNAAKTVCPKCGGPYTKNKRQRVCYPCYRQYVKEWKAR